MITTTPTDFLTFAGNVLPEWPRANAAGRLTLNRAMGELYVKAQELDTAERATAFWIIAGILADAAKLGRTEEWKSACAFAVLQVEAGHDVEWAVLQGSIYMAHANS